MTKLNRLGDLSPDGYNPQDQQAQVQDDFKSGYAWNTSKKGKTKAKAMKGKKKPAKKMK